MSKSLKLPLDQRPFYNSDAIAESIASDDMVDCYLEPVPGVGLITRRRPGLSLFADTATGYPGEGLFYWDAMDMVIAVSDNKVFNISSAGVSTALTGTFGGSGRAPVVFADGQALDGTPWLYMAANGLTYTTNGVSMVIPSDPNTPASATHVGWLNGRFIANIKGTNQFCFTDTNPATGNIENDYWSSTDNPLTAESRGDKLSALFCAFQEIYVWGQEGLEIWQDDGATPFSPIQSAFTEAGIEGIYAYGKIDNTIFALCVIEGKRVIIRMNARSPQIVSEPIARVLADLTTVSDALCSIISVGGIAIALFAFPTDNQSWAYDYKNDTWIRWTYYEPLTGIQDRFIGQFTCFAKTWNKHLIQSKTDGKIYELSRAVYTDNTVPMVTYRRTGWVDRGTWKRKRINQMFVKGKVFGKNSNPPSTMQIRFRNDGSPVWSTPINVSLNPDFQGNFIIPLNRMGMYRSRQYEFRLSDDVDMALIGADEDVEVMRN